MNISGELKTGSLKVEFLGSDATNYYIDSSKKTIDILIGNVKPKTNYEFDVSVINKSIIPVLCDLEYDNQVNSNNDIRVVEVVNDSLSGIDMMSNENNKSIVVQVNKPEEEIKGSDDGLINFKLLIGEEIKMKNYNYVQKLVFKHNKNSEWENELELKINIEILKDDTNKDEELEVTEEIDEKSETPSASPTIEPTKSTEATESPKSTDGINNETTDNKDNEINKTTGKDKKNIETISDYYEYVKDEFLPVD
jgi:hypothetical protein